DADRDRGRKLARLRRGLVSSYVRTALRLLSTTGSIPTCSYAVLWRRSWRTHASIAIRCCSPGRVISAAAPRVTETILGTARLAPRPSRSFTAPPTQRFGETGPAGTPTSCSWHRYRLATSCGIAAEAGIIVTAYANRAEAVLEVGRDGA